MSIKHNYFDILVFVKKGAIILNHANLNACTEDEVERERSNIPKELLRPRNVISST